MHRRSRIAGGIVLSWLVVATQGEAAPAVVCDASLRDAVRAAALQGSDRIEIRPGCFAGDPGGGAACAGDDPVVVPPDVKLRIARSATLRIEPDCRVRVESRLIVRGQEARQLFEPGSATAIVRLHPDERLRPEWWGAAGDGAANDTEAFQHLGRSISAMKRGNVRLRDDRAIYVVGRQSFPRTGTAGGSFIEQSILRIEGTEGPVEIDGRGATLRAATGLRFGSFDPVSGNRTGAVAPGDPQADEKRADAYWGMIQLRSNHAPVEIRDLELDGNMDGLVLGGEWGGPGEGWQVAAYGIWALETERLTIRDVHTFGHATDGIHIEDPTPARCHPAPCYRLIDVTSERNGRNGLTFAGGYGLRIEGSSFSHNGMGRISSNPRAGIDIEPHSLARDIVIGEGTRIEDNLGIGLVADTGDTSGITIEKTFIRAGRSHALWVAKPDFTCAESHIVGAVIHPFSGRPARGPLAYRGCLIEDTDAVGPTGPGFRPNELFYVDQARATDIHLDVEVTARRSGAIWLSPAPGPDGRGARVERLVVHHGHAARLNGRFQSLIRNAHIERARFTEAAFPAEGIDCHSDGSPCRWYIAVEGVTCDAGSVTVEGPRVGWRAPGGAVDCEPRPPESDGANARRTSSTGEAGLPPAVGGSKLR